nr:NADH dehydrogenase subunit 6 [Palaemon varians]
MYLLIFISMMLTSVALCFTFMAHPLALGLTLIVQTILVCIMNSLLSGLSWFSYILFLVFLGATLVLFIYVASLASNEIFKVTPIMTLILLTPLLTLPPAFMFDVSVIPGKELLESSFITYPQEFSGAQVKLNNMYSPVSANLTGLIILYLLLTLVVVVKLSSSFFGPLRLS